MLWSKEPTKYNFNKRCGMDFLIPNLEFWGKKINYLREFSVKRIFATNCFFFFSLFVFLFPYKCYFLYILFIFIRKEKNNLKFVKRKLRKILLINKKIFNVKIPSFNLIFWCWNIVKRHDFRIGSEESTENMWELCLSQKFLH